LDVELSAASFFCVDGVVVDASPEPGVAAESVTGTTGCGVIALVCPFGKYSGPRWPHAASMLMTAIAIPARIKWDKLKTAITIKISVG
jgi:hypothetical protein